jgi:hypothetical protein
MVPNNALACSKTIYCQSPSPVLYAANKSSFLALVDLFSSIRKLMNLTEFEIMNASEITFRLSDFVLGLSRVFARLSTVLLSQALEEN